MHIMRICLELSDVKLVPNADAEITELATIDPNKTLVIQNKYWDEKYNDALHL